MRRPAFVTYMAFLLAAVFRNKTVTAHFLRAFPITAPESWKMAGSPFAASSVKQNPGSGEPSGFPIPADAGKLRSTVTALLSATTVHPRLRGEYAPTRIFGKRDWFILASAGTTGSDE
jgi:hypothetical protein